MQNTQQAYREAGQSNQAPPKASKALNKTNAQGQPAPAKKKGPAEQATLPPPDSTPK
jgi:hypothetical protein